MRKWKTKAPQAGLSWVSERLEVEPFQKDTLHFIRAERPGNLMGRYDFIEARTELGIGTEDSLPDELDTEPEMLLKPWIFIDVSTFLQEDLKNLEEKLWRYTEYLALLTDEVCF